MPVGKSTINIPASLIAIFMHKIGLLVTDSYELVQAPAGGSATGHLAVFSLFQFFNLLTYTNWTSFNLLRYEKDIHLYQNPTFKNCLNQVDRKNRVLLAWLLLLANWRKLKSNLNLHSCNNFKIKKEDAEKQIKR